MSTLSSDPNLLKTKPHFKILDGLRGIAAISVVVFHFMEFAVPDYTKSFIAHSYLAVDFFFCLSGFVIAYAYDNKIVNMSTLQFLKLRLIRLHPLVVIGSVIGLIAFILDPYSNLQEVYGSGKTFLMFITSCLLLPYPVVPERYFNIFHLNPPTWSLFWEYIANIFYVLVLWKIPRKILVTLTLIAGAAICYEAFHTGNLSVGWGGDNISGGGIRVFYSFLAGILVYRSNWIIKSRLGFVAMGLLLFLVFIIPYSDSTNKYIEPLVVLFYFPFLIALGAGAELKAGFDKVCKFLGDISYPLYMVHYPFLWIFLSYIEKNKPGIGEMTVIMVIGTILLTVLAYLTMRWADSPIRKYLGKKLMT
ncbi:MAG: acyltransferase [Bacteroidota bacterium]